MDRAGIEGPTGDHGGAAGGDFFQEGGGARLWRADDDVAGDFLGGEFAVGREGEAEFLVDAREAERLRMKHHG
jgi:hypothetical protein